MKAMETLACALLTVKTGTDSNSVLLSQWLSLARSVKRAFQRLEPDAVKVASPVLRGRSGGNVTLLPDFAVAVLFRYNFYLI